MTIAPTFPGTDQNAEATHITAQAGAGAVFVKLRREVAGKVIRRSFVELTLMESMEFLAELVASIRYAQEAQAAGTIRLVAAARTRPTNPEAGADA